MPERLAASETTAIITSSAGSRVDGSSAGKTRQAVRSTKCSQGGGRPVWRVILWATALNPMPRTKMPTGTAMGKVPRAMAAALSATMPR